MEYSNIYRLEKFTEIFDTRSNEHDALQIYQRKKNRRSHKENLAWKKETSTNLAFLTYNR
jgi:hypothetical protein